MVLLSYAQNSTFVYKIKKNCRFLIFLWRKVVESGGKVVSLKPNSYINKYACDF